MRQLRSVLLIVGALTVLAGAGAGGASAAAVPRPCVKYSTELSHARAHLRELRKERADAKGRERSRLRREIRDQKSKIRRLSRKLSACNDANAGSPVLRASCVFKDAGPGEEAGDCAEFVESSNDRRAALRFEGAAVGVTGMKVVLPGGRQVTNYICPSELPTAQIATTNSTNDSLICSGGTLAVGDKATPTLFKFNIRMTPNPAAGMGAQLFLTYNGQLLGPFAITGP